jgi:tetratricopeptide (TPR) repeat protein
MGFAQSLFRKRGGKRSDNSFFWLGDYKNIKIGFKPDYIYESPVNDEELFPKHYLNLGIAQAKLGESSNNATHFEKAIEYFQIYIKKNPKDPIVYINMGGALLLLGQLKSDKSLLFQSLRNTSLAIKLGGRIYQTYLNRAIVLYILAEHENRYQLYEKAINDLHISIDIEPNWQAYSYLASGLLRLAQIKDSEELYKESSIYYKKAIEYNNADFKLNSNLAIVLTALGTKLKSEKYFKEAIKNFKLAIDKNGSPDVYLNWGICINTYSTSLDKPTLLSDAVEKILKSFLLSIMQKNFDYAIHVAFSILLRLTSEMDTRNEFILVYSFVEAIKYIQTKKDKSSISYELIEKIKGESKITDVIIDAILYDKFTLNSEEDFSADLTWKTAFFLISIIKEIE